MNLNFLKPVILVLLTNWDILCYLNTPWSLGVISMFLSWAIISLINSIIDQIIGHPFHRVRINISIDFSLIMSRCNDLFDLNGTVWCHIQHTSIVFNHSSIYSVEYWYEIKIKHIFFSFNTVEHIQSRIVLWWLEKYWRYKITHLGLYSLSGKTSYRQIWWSLEAARLDAAMVVSFWNLTGTSAAALPRYLPNFRAIGKV